MPSDESYLFNHQLPDNETYIMLNNILTISNCLAFIISCVIIYLSPPSKESYYYKLLIHSQGVFILLFSIVWSLLLKFIIHFNYKFFYCEGYSYLIGLTCANGYTLLCSLFGSYGFCTLGSYFFRLYLIVDHTHYLRTPYLFPILSIIFGFLSGFAGSFSFYIGYSEFNPNGLPFNLSQEQLNYMFTRTVASYTLQSLKQIFYPVYFIFFVLVVFTMIVFAIFEIVRTIHEKQNLMSTGSSTYHLKVLKVLTIQAVCIGSLSCCVPIVIASSLFINIHASVVNGFMLLFGANSLLQSVLTISLNPGFRKTTLTLIGQVWMTVSTIRVNPVSK